MKREIWYTQQRKHSIQINNKKTDILKSIYFTITNMEEGITVYAYKSSFFVTSGPTPFRVSEGVSCDIIHVYKCHQWYSRNGLGIVWVDRIPMGAELVCIVHDTKNRPYPSEDDRTITIGTQLKIMLTDAHTIACYCSEEIVMQLPEITAKQVFLSHKKDDDTLIEITIGGFNVDIYPFADLSYVYFDGSYMLSAPMLIRVVCHKSRDDDARAIIKERGFKAYPSYPYEFEEENE